MSTQELNRQDQDQRTNGADDNRVVRLSVNLAPDVADALKSSAASERVTVTEAVRRAIALWKLVTAEVKKGNRVMIVEGEGDRAKYREIVML